MRLYNIFFISLLFVCIITLTPAQDAPPRAAAPALTPESIQEAEKLVEEIYKDKLRLRDPEELAVFIDELLTEGSKDSNEAATRYVLLSKAMDLASRIGRASDAMKALSLLEDLTGQSQAEKKMDALKMLSRNARSEQELKELAEIYFSFSSELEQQQKYNDASDALGLAYKFAVQSRDKDLKTAILIRKKELAAAEKEFEKAGKALKILSSDPSHEKANLAAGSYFCFIKHNWEKGLPYLAKGSDIDLKSAASEDMKLTAMSDEDLGWSKDSVLKLADLWYTIADKERDKLVQGMIGARSALWYAKALAMTEGLKKKIIKDKLEKAEKLAAGASAVSAGSIPYGAVSIVTFNKNTVIEKDGVTWIKNMADEKMNMRLKDGRIIMGKAGEGLEVPAGKEGTYQIPYKPKITIDLPYTISIWVKFKKIEEGGYITFLGGVQGELGSSWYCGIRLRVMQPGGGGGSTYTADRNLLKSGEWIHVTATVDGKNGDPFSDKNVFFYINGKKVGTSPHGKGTLGPLGLQQTWFGSTEFEGMIDEFAVWNRALTEKEVEQVYSLGKSGKTLK